MVDALGALCAYVGREWGLSGYRPEEVRTGPMGVFLRVACSDGSRFWVATDRHACWFVHAESVESVAMLMLARHDAGRAV